MNDAKNEIENISIEDFCWLNIVPGRISFEIKSFAPGIHFTISWDAEQHVNLHLTRNINAPLKPKIEIIRWKKSFVNVVMNVISQRLEGKVYLPFAIKSFSRKNRKQGKVVFFDQVATDLGKDTFEGLLIDHFLQHSSRSKKRIKVLKSIIENLKEAPVMPYLLDHLVHKGRSLRKGTFKGSNQNAGILYINGEAILFCWIKGRLFKINSNFSIKSLMYVCRPEFVELVMDRISESLKIISTANSYHDTQAYHCPIELLPEHISYE